MRLKQPPDLGFQPLPARPPRRFIPVPPLVKPRLGHAQRLARHRLRDAVICPLSCDEPGHGYLLPIASLTQRATLRLRTSRSIASSAFSFRSRTSSARSSSPSAPSASPRRRRSALTQLPKVPSLTPGPGPPARSACPSPGPAAPRPPGSPYRTSCASLPSENSSPLRGSLHAARGNPVSDLGVGVVVE